MRLLPALAFVVLLAAAVPTNAQPTFTEPYQVRGALGDIPTTPAAEAGGMWNVEQQLRVQFDNASAQEARTWHFVLPSGATLANATCDCRASTHQVTGSAVDFEILPQTASGERTIRILSRQPAATAFAFSLGATPIDGEAVAILYVPGGSGVTSDLDLTEVGATTTGTSVIHYARASTDELEGAWFAIHPATATVDGTGGDGDDAAWREWIVPVLVGLVVGAVLWAALVSKGLVQAKSRKQVATTAAHVEAAAAESPAVLEGKKRALLAALKEVELAKQANEMPIEVYDAVKADLKKQAVTVMRALEAGSGGEAPKA